MLRRVISYLNFSRKMSVFTQQPNPITGVTTWEEQDADYDYHQEVARSAFADMLHDHERNEKYYIALKAAIEKMHKHGKPANVLDIGTGTGLLSMMAAKCGADSVVACEAFKPMAICAAKIIKENGYEDKIKLVYKRSQKLTVGEDGDLIQRANILVTEVFDTELIGEGALSTFKHALDELLEKDCIVVPSSGTVYAQVVDSQTVRKWNQLLPIKDANNKTILDAQAVTMCCPGATAVHDIQLSQLPRDCFTPLTPPQPIFRFDWSGKEPLVFDESKHIQTTALASGTAHAVFMWWDLVMDTDEEVLLSCAPVWEHPDVKERISDSKTEYQKLVDEIPWRDHWMQAIYYLPKETQIKVGSEIHLFGFHDEYSFRFYVTDTKTDHLEPKLQKPVCDCFLHIAYSRTRIGQLNDTKRNENYLKSLSKVIKQDSTCLCISDGSLLGLATLNLGAKKLYMLETNYLSRRTMEHIVSVCKLNDKVEIIDSIDKLPLEKDISAIFGEPYFVTSLMPWGNLRFWYIISSFSNNVIKMPCKLSIKAVAVEFKDLQKIRAPLGICEGFDMTIFDKLIENSNNRADSPVEAQPLWEYPSTALCDVFTIVDLDLTKDINALSPIKMSENVQLSEKGVCNGVAIWIDWQLDSDVMVSTGPIEKIIPGERISWDPYTRQGVHLLRKIREIEKGDTLNWSFTFLPKDGSLSFSFKHFTK